MALDFDIWAKSPSKDVQKAHLNHFSVLLETSKFRRFNLKQRLSKFNIVRKLLFVLQTDVYSNDMIPLLVQTIGMYIKHHFAADTAIKPVVGYLAANLHEGIKCSDNFLIWLISLPSETLGTSTPRSVATRPDQSHRRELAEQVYEVLVHNLSNASLLSKFTLALPLSRVLLLLLGEHPTSIVASQTLILLGLVLNASPSFNRKFELVSGWSALKVILPLSWDPSVHVAAFDLLLGRVFVAGKSQHSSGQAKIVCPYILPAILTSLAYGLERVNSGSTLPPITPSHGVLSHGAVFSHENYSVTSAMEVLAEELIDLHSSASTFRQLFKSKQTTSILVNACQSFISKMYEFPQARGKTERLIVKVTDLVAAVAADGTADEQQKQQVRALLHY